MNYTLNTHEATMAASEFTSRFRDVERIGQYCLECPGYGKSWGCPPFDFDPRSVTEGFNTVTVMGTMIEFDEETRRACTTAQESARVGHEAMAQVLQSLLPDLYEMERRHPGSRVFTFRCVLCPEGCTRPQGKPCRHPDRLRHSLESVGYDVEAIARDLLGITLEWSTDGSLSKHITLITALFTKTE